MAVTQREAQATERRLRPLYDAIDNGQNRKAIQLSDKIIRKHDDLHCAKALKAIALLRSGKSDEAYGLIQRVMEVHPGDQATLQAVTLFFRETGDHERIVELYAMAAQHYPKNQEILTHLFMAYVRVGDYAKQQQTAAQLHKAFPESGPYYCWRIMSILMQAHEAQGKDIVNTMYLPLALRLIEKYISENEVDAEAEIRLYLMILERMEQTEKLLEVVRGPLGSKLKSVEERCKAELECLLILGRLEQAVELLVPLMKDSPDNWSFIGTYINCQIKRALILRAADEDKKTTTPAGGSEEEDVSRSVDQDSDGSPATELEDRVGGLTLDEDGSGDGVQRQPAEPCGDRLSSSSSSSAAAAGEEAGSCEGGSSCEGESGGSKDSGLDEETLQSRAEACAPKEYVLLLMQTRDYLECLVAEEQRKALEAAPATYVYRGPFLGRMEFTRALMQHGLHHSVQLASCASMLGDYFALFSPKGCCFRDLAPFLSVFPSEDVHYFVSQLEMTVGNEPINFDCSHLELKENVDKLRRHISLLQLQRFTERYDPSLEAESEMVELCKRYFLEGRKLSPAQEDSGSPPTPHSNFYLILAAQLKITIYAETNDISHLWEAVFLLEFGGRSDPQISVLLMKLYGFLGATEPITEVFDAISIKNIQIETLGYIPVRYIQSMGTLGYAEQFYRIAMRFYFGSSKEIAEYVIQAYKNGIFHKIKEFVMLRDRLTYSLYFIGVLVDMNCLEFLTSVNNIHSARIFFRREWFSSSPFQSEQVKDYTDRLLDGRDLRVSDDWAPPKKQLSDDEINVSFELECLWLRVRITLLRCLKEAMSLADDPPTRQLQGGKSREAKEPLVFSGKYREFAETLDEMQAHVGMTLLKQKTIFLTSVNTPPTCLGFMFFEESHPRVLMSLLRVVECLAMGESSVEELLQDSLQWLHRSLSQLAGVPEDLRTSVVKVASRSVAEGECEVALPPEEHPYTILARSHISLERYVLFLQLVNYVVLVCGTCAELIKPPLPPDDGHQKKKKKKKAVATVVNTSTPIIISPACREMEGFVKDLRGVLLRLTQLYAPLPALEHGLSERLNALYTSDKMDDPRNFEYLNGAAHHLEYSAAVKVCCSALLSYNMSLKDCLPVVQTKLKFVNQILRKLGPSEAAETTAIDEG